MPETLDKLQPNRDLQCYFERPSAIAALSGATSTGFTLSGVWRQQFDWAVVEWNRDNVFEHPLLRNLPDGDLSGLRLTYEEARQNCIPMDSSLFPTVDWPFLRIWADDNGVERLYKVKLKDHATPIEGFYRAATAEFTIQGTVTAGDYVGVAWVNEHHTYQLYGSDTLASAAQAIVDSVNAFSAVMRAERIGSTVRLHYVGTGGSIGQSAVGAEGNRVGVYSYVAGAGTEHWDTPHEVMSGGLSPTKWRIAVDFTSLRDEHNDLIPTAFVRKMRWTYAASMQEGSYARSELAVCVTAWETTGVGRSYKIAGPGTQRYEDQGSDVQYMGTWSTGKGNFSGGSIHYTSHQGSAAGLSYETRTTHDLYLGTRYAPGGATVRAVVDQSAQVLTLRAGGDDVLGRINLGSFGPGPHTVLIEHIGNEAEPFYLDYFETVVPQSQLPEIEVEDRIAVATDWDTDHSIALPAERTAWLVDRLGLHGRVNHYVGAMWFYELLMVGQEYAFGGVTFEGTPEPNTIVRLSLGRLGEPPELRTVIERLVHVGDSCETIAQSLAFVLNDGYTAVRADASGNMLQIWSRAMGVAGNQIIVEVTPASGVFRGVTQGPTLAGGIDGSWTTDVQAVPRLNRAARDWSRCFFQALASQGRSVTAAFSMELQHGDGSVEAGIAQRYPDGTAVVLNTPALQTNFAPASIAYWRQVYLDMAALMAEAGQAPYLQFGEVQWWYFPSNGSGMPYYDEYTVTEFETRTGRALPVFTNSQIEVGAYAQETAFLSGLVGAFTQQVAAHVRSSYPSTKFEVLYPTDVNDTPLNGAVNYPTEAWTPQFLECLKTESFSYTFSRDLTACERSYRHGAQLGFPASKRSHLVGIGDEATPWVREVRNAEQEVGDSVVLFALDQLCLIGYRLPLSGVSRRAVSYD